MHVSLSVLFVLIIHLNLLLLFLSLLRPTCLLTTDQGAAFLVRSPHSPSSLFLALSLPLPRFAPSSLSIGTGLFLGLKLRRFRDLKSGKGRVVQVASAFSNCLWCGSFGFQRVERRGENRYEHIRKALKEDVGLAYGGPPVCNCSYGRFQETACLRTRRGSR
ncbi:hypothetical protein F5Y17DRAFT_196781 [Xylariaceae sp. FL0594]|nr:hypothetical protein F5Y17DRAFT_196781 [Xylariaceae sp. FL0594]